MSVSTKNTVGAGLTAVALFLFWTHDVVSYQQISFYNDAIEKRQQLVAERRAILDKIQSLDREYQQHAEKIKQFSLIVPSDKKITELITAFDAIAIQAGAYLKNLGVVADVSNQQTELNRVSIDLSASGTYEALQTFLSNIEQHVRIIDIDFLDIKGTGEGSGNLTLELRAIAYFLK